MFHLEVATQYYDLNPQALRAWVEHEHFSYPTNSPDARILFSVIQSRVIGLADALSESENDGAVKSKSMELLKAIVRFRQDFELTEPSRATFNQHSLERLLLHFGDFKKGTGEPLVPRIDTLLSGYALYRRALEMQGNCVLRDIDRPIRFETDSEDEIGRRYSQEYEVGARMNFRNLLLAEKSVTHSMDGVLKFSLSSEQIAEVDNLLRIVAKSRGFNGEFITLVPELRQLIATFYQEIIFDSEIEVPPLSGGPAALLNQPRVEASVVQKLDELEATAELRKLAFDTFTKLHEHVSADTENPAHAGQQLCESLNALILVHESVELLAADIRELKALLERPIRPSLELIGRSINYLIGAAGTEIISVPNKPASYHTWVQLEVATGTHLWEEEKQNLMLYTLVNGGLITMTRAAQDMSCGFSSLKYDAVRTPIGESVLWQFAEYAGALGASRVYARDNKRYAGRGMTIHGIDIPKVYGVSDLSDLHQLKDAYREWIMPHAFSLARDADLTAVRGGLIITHPDFQFEWHGRHQYSVYLYNHFFGGGACVRMLALPTEVIKPKIQSCSYVASAESLGAPPGIEDLNGYDLHPSALIREAKKLGLLVFEPSHVQNIAWGHATICSVDENLTPFFTGLGDSSLLYREVLYPAVSLLYLFRLALAEYKSTARVFTTDWESGEKVPVDLGVYQLLGLHEIARDARTEATTGKFPAMCLQPAIDYKITNNSPISWNTEDLSLTVDGKVIGRIAANPAALQEAWEMYVIPRLFQTMPDGSYRSRNLDARFVNGH